MKRCLLVFLAAALIVHIAAVALIPNAIMFIYFERMKSANTELNKIYHAPPINASFREVVLPSPDLLYSYCIYDLSKGPVLITAEVPENTYWSVSLYDSATNNFLTLNDRQAGKLAKILLVKEQTHLEKLKDVDAVVVRAKSEKGLVLFRTFIPNSSLISYLDDLRNNWSCSVVEQNIFI